MENGATKVKRPKTDRMYRHVILWPHLYDRVGIDTFAVLKDLGLKVESTLLDVGCGSLCSGRHFLAYLEAGNYYAVEPNTWLLEEMVEKELGENWPGWKEMHLYSFDDFKLSRIGRTFDFVLAHSIFTHATQAQVKTIMDEARQVMHADSVFAATYYYASADSDRPEWSWPGGVSYTDEFIVRTAAECRLRIERLATKHPVGHTWAVMRRE